MIIKHAWVVNLIKTYIFQVKNYQTWVQKLETSTTFS
jgi:hypothetical protein